MNRFALTRPPGKAGIRLLAGCLILSGLLLFAGTGSADEKTITNTLGMTFIRVEPGTFFMGSPDTEKHRDRNEVRHEEKITAAYYLQETEVTLKQWWAVMGKNWFLKRKGPDTLPVTRVSFYDCEKFIRKLNQKGDYTYRLPREKEWEYACRAGSTTAYHWGDDIDCDKAMYANSHSIDDCALYYKSMKIPFNGPAPVKSFAPNAWGFFDMHGNVWEWCADEYDDYFREPGEEQYNMMNTDHRLRRGGSWYKYPWYLRSANRAYGHPGGKFKTTGFRLIIEAK